MMNIFFNTIFSRLTKSCLFLALFLGGMALIAAQSVPSGTFAGGDGTEQSPYLIKTKQQLAAIAKFTGEQYKGVYFKQMANIVFDKKDFAEGGEFYNQGNGWLPIGMDDKHLFMGNFDGGMKSIRNLTMTTVFLGDRKSILLGLFGGGKGCVIKNVVLQDYEIRITQGEFFLVGGIIAFLDAKSENLVTHNHAEGKIVTSSATKRTSIGGIVSNSWGKETVISHNSARIYVETDNQPTVSHHELFVAGICVCNAGVVNNNTAFCELLYPNVRTSLGGVVLHNVDTGKVSQNYATIPALSVGSWAGIVHRNWSAGNSGNNVAFIIMETENADSIVDKMGDICIKNKKPTDKNHNCFSVRTKDSSEGAFSEIKNDEKGGTVVGSPLSVGSWKKMGFSFGKTPEAPWVMGQDRLPVLYWHDEVQKNVSENIVESFLVE